ncbi:MAG: M3 family metallopeptidase [bacterium]|nr:M3 family metallopeptidase [bacterium]
MCADLSDNPFLATEGLPPFDRMEAEHVVPAMEQVLADSATAIVQIESSLTPTWEGLLQPLDELGIPHEYSWGCISHLMGVKNSPALRTAHEEMQPKLVEIGLRISQSKPVYEGLKAIRDGAEWERLDEAQRRIVEQNIRGAEHAGVGLEGADKERFLEISRELSQIGTQFSNNVLDARKAFELVLTDKTAATGWPQSLRHVAAQSYNEARTVEDSAVVADATEATAVDGPWRITLDYPSYLPFMQHHRGRSEREQLYRAQTTLASSGKHDNTDLITQTLRLRKERVALLGYDTYADFSLSNKMAPDVAAVDQMFSELSGPSRAHAEQDLQDLRQLARDGGQQEALAHWDLPFWSERLREQRFDYTDDELRPYFPMPRVLDGLFGVTQRLFDVTVESADGAAPVWHKDVRYFKVKDADGRQVASFYLDPYSRPQDKRGGAWMNECLTRRRVSGKLSLPVVHLVCNGTPPVGDTPSLMSFSEVETLFHEFGHGLQGMLSTVDYGEASGINGVEWDAVELASQFMENWCYHKPTLTGMTKHVETGAPLPDDLFDKISAARTFFAGTQMLRQLEFGKTDMTLHHAYDTTGSDTVFDVHRRVADEMSVFPLFADDRRLCSFTHIFAGGYAAGYYSYKWAEVLSADAWGAFEEAGLDNEEALQALGRRFRDTVLALGGGRHPMDVFRDFRGREPDTQALLRHSGLL